MTFHHVRYRSTALPTRRVARARGFTLIELIMVVVLLGVLAVVAAPRIFNTGDFNARGFHDETLGLLRYAQKSAIAQRRTVCVSFTANGASLAMASVPAATACGVSVPLTGPKGAATIQAKSGVSYTSTPASGLNFDGLGRPIAADGTLMATQTITISNADAVVVEAGTGYVHD